MDYSPPGSSVHDIFPRREYWSGLHALLQGIFLTQGSNPCLLHWQVDSVPTELPEKPPVCFTRAKPKVNLITQINKAELASNVIGPTFCREMTWLKLQYPNRVFLPLLPEEWKQFP